MTLIETRTLETWNKRARAGALNKALSLCEFRDILKEARAEGGHVVMQMYREASEAMVISPETLRDDMGKIREYPFEQLCHWINNGLSFDHFEKANQLAEVAHKTPAQLLNEAIDPGNAEGKTMTVTELVAFAIGEVAHSKKVEVYHFSKWADSVRRLPNKFGWDDEKRARFAEKVNVFLNEIQAEFMS